MISSPTADVNLADAIDIPHWLEADRRMSWQQRHARDRRIGREPEVAVHDPVARVLAWWQRVSAGARDRGPGRDVAAMTAHVDVVVVVAGAVSGLALAAAVFRYDGSDPINVLVVFGLLVVAPLVFLCLSLIVPFLPSGSAVEMNVGSLVVSILRSRADAGATFFSLATGDASRLRCVRWRVAMWSQQFGFMFSLAALVVLVAKSGFSDLAFSWSTTLGVSARDMETLTAVIAAPWSAWFPHAVPTHELIEQSRYFRLDRDDGMLSAPALTAWWRFVALSIVTYGIVPRVLAYAVARLGFRSARRRLLLAHVEVRALLDRLETPVVAAASQTTERGLAPSQSRAGRFDGAANADLVVVWNDAPCDENAATVLHAASARDIDAGLGDDIPQRPDVIRVVTKAWEPPLLEFHDFLLALRQRVGPEASIVVYPVETRDRDVDEATLAIWRESLGRLDDPRIYVR